MISSGFLGVRDDLPPVDPAAGGGAQRQGGGSGDKAQEPAAGDPSARCLAGIMAPAGNSPVRPDDGREPGCGQRAPSEIDSTTRLPACGSESSGMLLHDVRFSRSFRSAYRWQALQCSGPPLTFESAGSASCAIPVASQAVAHAHGHALIDDLHVLHFAVAGLAEDAGAHMRPVIEVNVIRQPVDPLPFQGFTRSIYGGELLDVRAVRLGHLVAVHARLDSRDPGKTRLESTGVAVETGNLQDAGVQLVGIRDGLLRARSPARTGPAACTSRRRAP